MSAANNPTPSTLASSICDNKTLMHLEGKDLNDNRTRAIITTTNTNTNTIATTTKTTTGIAALDKFIQLLEHEFKSAKQQNPVVNGSGAVSGTHNNEYIDNGKTRVNEENVKRLFEEFTTGKKSKESFHLKDLMKYCYFDSETPYTRNLIHENEHFSLMLLIWNTNAKRYAVIHSFIHLLLLSS